MICFCEKISAKISTKLLPYIMMWDSKQNTLEQIAVPNTEYDTDFFFFKKKKESKNLS